MDNFDLLHQALDLIEQHGLSVVLLIGIIFLNIALFKWLGKKVDQLWKVFLQVKGDLPDTKKENIEMIVRLNVQIKSLLKEAMIEAGAGWVQLWQFHNGTRGIGRGKLPFMFLSLTNEAHRPELDEMRQQFKELPLSMFDYFATQLIESDFVIHTPDMTAPDGARSGMGRLMLAHGAKISVMRTVRDIDGDIIGFVSFVFPTEVQLGDSNKRQIMNFSQRMTALLASFDETEEDQERHREAYS